MLFTPMTKKAMTLAYEAHHGQTDRSGVPCIFHSARVAEGFINNEAMACVAWLHDTAEDTDLSIQNIRLEGFGGAICDAIQLLTHDKSVSYMDYVRQVAKNPIARAVKLADLRDSMDTSRLDRVDETVEKQLAEYREAYRFLSGEQD